VVIFEDTICELQDKVRELKQDKEALENNAKAMEARIKALEKQVEASRQIKEMQCCNEPSYCLCSLNTQGTLFQDARITLRCLVTRSKETCTLDMTLDNLLSTPLTKLTVDFLVQDSGLSLNLEAGPPDLLQPAQQCSLTAVARSSAPYSDAPVMLLQFVQDGTPSKLLLKLPVPLSRFLTATPKTPAELTSFLQQYSICCSKKSIPSAAGQGLLEKLSLAGALSVSTFGEGLVAVGQGYGHPILVKTEKEAERIAFSCYTPDPRVRDALLALLATLLQT
jgi:hypothetical protein